MPAEGEPIGSCGGAPGNEPAHPRPGAPAHETGPTVILWMTVNHNSKQQQLHGSSSTVVPTGPQTSPKP